MNDKPITCTEREQWAKALKYARLEAEIAHRRIERDRRDRKQRQVEMILGGVLLICAGICVAICVYTFCQFANWLSVGWR